MSRFLSPLLLCVACSNAPTPAAVAPASPLAASGTAPVVAARAAPASQPPAAPFRCTEVIGLTVTAEWYEAGFEQAVDDARFQARTRPHTFVDQWADPAHEAWSGPLTSPCADQPQSPDRVVVFVANWKLGTEDEWREVLSRLVGTLRHRYPAMRALELYTVLRGPRNQSCGDPKSVVDPMIDRAIDAVAAAQPELVHAGPRLEAIDCAVFEKGGPHFTAEGRKSVAAQLAAALR